MYMYVHCTCTCAWKYNGKCIHMHLQYCSCNTATLYTDSLFPKILYFFLEKNLGIWFMLFALSSLSNTEHVSMFTVGTGLCTGFGG